MKLPTARAPGLAFEAVRPAPAESPLRTDIAAFVGPTRRGPVGVPVRVEGWRGYVREFGGLDRDYHVPYAVRGYFENGGEVAWILRLAGRGVASSAADWAATDLADLPAATFRVEARSPGAWSDGARVTFSYRGRTSAGAPTVDVQIAAGDESEDLRSIPAADLVAQLALRSRLIALVPTTPRGSGSGAPARSFAAVTLTLRGGASSAPATPEYRAALDLLDDLPEVALVAFPDLHRDQVDAAAIVRDAAARAELLHRDQVDAAAIVRDAAARAELLRDRLVLVDLPPLSPPARWHATDITNWIEGTLDRRDGDLTGTARWWRAAALYHPWVRVHDPLGGVARPTRDVPPSGHVAGVISRLDRERGAHSTPANTPLVGVLDLFEEYDNDEHALLNAAGVDLLRCVPAVGFSVWGGRTLDRDHRFVAHRRLIHRLVRAIRRVAEPLQFETNGPALWFALVRAITAVLLAAWRAGALAGGRPDEAFLVTCDETTNPPEEIEQGRCLCTIEVAPAVPMEFILIRVALSQDGALEVLS